MSGQSSPFHRSWLAVLKHAATQTLVESGECALENWAKEFAEHRAKYEKIVCILHPGQLPNELKASDARARVALAEGDSFVLSRASSSWTGEWVDPRWKKAALARESGERAARAAQVLDAQDVDFGYLKNEPGVAENFEDNADVKPKRLVRHVLAAVEMPPNPTVKKTKSPTPLPKVSAPTAKKRGSETAAKAGRTRSQLSLKRRSISSLGVRRRASSPPLTCANSPKCKRCAERGLECFSALTRARCESCSKRRLACSLVKAQKNKKHSRVDDDSEMDEESDEVDA